MLERIIKCFSEIHTQNFHPSLMVPHPFRNPKSLDETRKQKIIVVMLSSEPGPTNDVVRLVPRFADIKFAVHFQKFYPHSTSIFLNLLLLTQQLLLT